MTRLTKANYALFALSVAVCGGSFFAPDPASLLLLALGFGLLTFCGVAAIALLVTAGSRRPR